MPHKMRFLSVQRGTDAMDSERLSRGLAQHLESCESPVSLVAHMAHAWEGMGKCGAVLLGPQYLVCFQEAYKVGVLIWGRGEARSTVPVNLNLE